MGDDVALIQLKNPIEYNNPIRPIALPTEADRNMYEGGKAVTVAGWGTMEDGTWAAQSDVLQKLVYGMVSQDDCKTYWPWIDDSMQCTGSVDSSGNPAYDERHTWAGDSGSPLFVQKTDGKYVQASLVSWGTSDDTEMKPDVNAHVLNNIEWISQQLACYGQDGPTAACNDDPVDPVDPVDPTDPEGNYTLSLYGGGNSSGLVLVKDEEYDQHSFLCAHGMGRNEINSICHYFGYKYGSLYDPSDEIYYDQYLSMLSFGATDISCHGKDTADVFNECTWEEYGQASVPCFDGEQVAVICDDEAFRFSLSGYTKIKARKDYIVFFVYPYIDRHGMFMEEVYSMGDEIELVLFNRNSSGNYEPLDMYQTKYRKKMNGWKGKASYVKEADNTCIIFCGVFKDTMIYQIAIGTCDYEIHEMTVYEEVGAMLAMYGSDQNDSEQYIAPDRKRQNLPDGAAPRNH